MASENTSAPVRFLEHLAGGVGEPVRRDDGVPKVTGAFSYGSDLWMDGMLWGTVLRSPHAHATITSVDISAALASPGVHAVLLADDVPGKRTFGLNYADQPVLASDVVLYEGEPVALIAAETPELGRRAAARVVVDWDPLPVVTDMEQALRDDAPRLREWGNVLRHVHIEHGDLTWAGADVWVEGYYETGMQDQAPLGPEAGLAIPSEDGGVELYAVTQWLHVDREQIAPCLNLPEDMVRITLAGVGGAFGAREDIHMQIHACLLALRTGRPIKMSYGREESFHGHVHRHPARMWLRHGATKDGRLVAVAARLLMDGGAYASSSPAVIANASTFAAGPYEVPNAEIEGTVVYTNNPPCGAMRGFGAPQVCFAHEAQMDKLAAALGADPLELRLRNALRTGSVLPTGQVIRGSAPVRELIQRCTALPLPAPTGDGLVPGGIANVTHGEGVKRGVGLAVGYKNVAFSEGFDDWAQARITLTRGQGAPIAEIHTAAVEMGQGLYTILAQIVRSELGVGTVIQHVTDTQIGNAGSTSASRQTMMAGGAVLAASAQARDELFRRARHRAAPGGSLDHKELTLAQGWVAVDGQPQVALTELLDEPVVATADYRHRPTQDFDPKGRGDIHVSFAFAVVRAVVDVDEELGIARIVQLAAAQDVGRAINPLGIQGQIEGGMAQGLGFALMEELKIANGVMANASFTDYLIPTILDMPPVVSALVEVPEPDAPYGVKGIGESTTVVTPAAVAAAFRAATGRELNRIPITPDELTGLRGPARTAGPAPIPEVPGQRPLPEYFGMASAQGGLMT